MAPTNSILIQAMTEALSVDGAFIELGVFKGGRFALIVAFAKEHGRLVRGFDSFAGMQEPAEQDAGHYPKGSMNAYGTAACVERLRSEGIEEGDYKLICGYIPDTFKKADFDSVAFAHIDLDQYIPTKAALDWAWERMPAGGIILCHDYFRGRRCLASLAIDEFIIKNKGACVINDIDYTAKIRKLK